MTQIHFGPQFNTDGTVTFRVWARGCESLDLQWNDDADGQALAMQRSSDGFFTLRTPAAAGMRYWFRLPSGTLRPDPASRFQPAGVHGPSQLIDDTAFAWTDRDFRGVSKQRMVLYELHVGAFTAAGSYAGLSDRLPELVDLGVNTIELMPVAQTAGDRNWGYDGVNLFAPRHTYGTPDQLRQFVDEAHRLGVSVVLDVVYNHFGAEGNYLHEFGGYVSRTHTTAWGDAPNFDESGSRTMRDFIVANCSYWIEAFHLDGLRLDAVHCMADHSTPHVVHEIGQVFAELQQRTTRRLHLIGESNVYDPDLLRPLAEDGHGFDSIWCDDFLHSVSAILRPNDHMSSRRYRRHDDLDLTLRRGFVFQGGLATERRRVPIEEPTAATSIESLIVSIQNHDFVGNHPQGLRLHQLVSLQAHQAAAALMLLYPAIPMLFMGEESAADQPFFFFTDFGDAPLRTAVEEGRRREYPQHDWSLSESPLSAAAFQQSTLGKDSEAALTMRSWYRQLLAIRRDWQEVGRMHSSNLSAAWSEEHSLASLTYRSGQQSAFALIRLHSPTESPDTIRLDIDTNDHDTESVDAPILLSNLCSQDPHAQDPHAQDSQRSTRWNLQPYAVLIGWGTVSTVASTAGK